MSDLTENELTNLVRELFNIDLGELRYHRTLRNKISAIEKRHGFGCRPSSVSADLAILGEQAAKAYRAALYPEETK